MTPSNDIFRLAGRLMDDGGVYNDRVGSGPTTHISSGNSSVGDLEARVEQQSLMIQTLLMILLEKKVIQEEEFREWLVYVDELDGVRDGKLKQDKSPITCPKCKRNNSRNRTSCQYCGEDFPMEFLQHLKK